MKINIAAIILLFSVCSTGSYASDLHYNVRGANSTAYMNTLIKIENRGVRGELVYSPSDEALIKAEEGAKISIQNVELGAAPFGMYKGVYIEYSLDEDVSDGCFEFSLDNSAYIMARIPVARTNGNVYVRGVVYFDRNLIGKHKICITWRGQGAALKAFGFVENTPIASIKVENTGGTYKLLSTALKDVEGKHHLRLVWRNHSANIKTIYLDGENLNSISTETKNGIKMYASGNRVSVFSENQLIEIKVFDLSGRTNKIVQPNDIEPEIVLDQGVFIITATDISGEILQKKIIITE